MTSVAAFWKWALIGGLTALILVIAQTRAVGGVEGLLQVGEESLLRPLIEDELGQVPLAPASGHDGQIYYAIAMDLDGDLVSNPIGDSGYRFRRILYPVLSSLGGLLEGRALLFGFIAVAIASTAVAAGSVAAVASRSGHSDWVALVVLLNPGIWLSIRLLTADVLALALMTLALFFVSRRETKATVLALSLSTLAKDVYLLTAAGLAISEKRSRWVILTIPALVLILWAAWLQLTIGGAFTPRGNLALPFVGLAEASSNWTLLSFEELLYLFFAMGSVAIGLLTGIFRESWLRWPIVLWSLMAITSSNWVWDFGNNAARAFAPIAVLVALSFIRSDFSSGMPRTRSKTEAV